MIEDAWASVPLTLPSHATILSGLEPPRHGVHDNGAYVFPAEPPTLATRPEGARGYATGAFVGAYVLDRRFGLARGFDHYDDRIERNAQGASVLESERRGEEVARRRGSLDRRRRRGRFFAWVHLYDPHAPYDPPSPQREAFAGRALRRRGRRTPTRASAACWPRRARAGGRAPRGRRHGRSRRGARRARRKDARVLRLRRDAARAAGAGRARHPVGRAPPRASRAARTSCRRCWRASACRRRRGLDGADLLAAPRRTRRTRSRSTRRRSAGRRCTRSASGRCATWTRRGPSSTTSPTTRARPATASPSARRRPSGCARRSRRCARRRARRRGRASSAETAERLGALGYVAGGRGAGRPAEALPRSEGRARRCGSASRRRAGPRRAATTRARCRRCARWCATSPATPRSAARWLDLAAPHGPRARGGGAARGGDRAADAAGLARARAGARGRGAGRARRSRAPSGRSRSTRCCPRSHNHLGVLLRAARRRAARRWPRFDEAVRARSQQRARPREPRQRAALAGPAARGEGRVRARRCARRRANVDALNGLGTLAVPRRRTRRGGHALPARPRAAARSRRGAAEPRGRRAEARPARRGARRRSTSCCGAPRQRDVAARARQLPAPDPRQLAHKSIELDPNCWIDASAGLERLDGQLAQIRDLSAIEGAALRRGCGLAMRVSSASRERPGDVLPGERRAQRWAASSDARSYYGGLEV